MFRRSLITALALSVFCAPAISALAADATVNDFKRSARVIPNALRGQGYEGLGRLRLAEFLQDMEGVKVVSVDWISRPEGPDTARSTAEWKRLNSREAEIRVNRQMWAQAKGSVKAVIALHEHLGIAGFNDRQYVLSTALWFLSLSETTRNLQNDERKSLVANVSTMARSGGGITGVGGGGDLAGVSTRMSLLKRGIGKLAGTTGAERNKRLQQLNHYFDFRTEVRWVNPKRTDRRNESMPTEIAGDVGMFELCQEYLGMSSSSQRSVYQKMRTDPAVVKKFPSLSSFQKYCRQKTAGGALN